MVRIVVAWVLAVSGLAVLDLVVAPAPPAEAVQATAGAARYKSIEWISWGATQERIPNEGRSVTETSTIAGRTLAVTCKISTIARTAGRGTGELLIAYRSGSWQGDGFDELYNIGGTGANNRMVVGLGNRTDGDTVTFDLSCSATLDKRALPLAGLVMADAEASGSNEHVAATIPRTNPVNGLPTTWRIIDRVRGQRCTLAATARRSLTGTVANGTDTLALYGPKSNTCENDSTQFPGASAIAFMENVTSATNVTIAGGGKSAIALGVALDFDFGGETRELTVEADVPEGVSACTFYLLRSTRDAS